MATRDYRTAHIDREALLRALESGNYRTPSDGQTGTPAHGPSATFDDLTAAYDRRNEGAGGFGRGAARGAATGATVGSVVPGLGTMAGAAIGGIGGGIAGLFSKNAETAKTDFSVQDARKAIGDAYQAYLGREASPEEITDQIMGQGWQVGDRWVGEAGLRSVIDSIAKSDEAKGYRPQTTTTGPVANGGSGNTATGQETTTPDGTFTGGSGALVDPYELPVEEEIAGLLANGQRYENYDPATGRSGVAASGISGYANAGFDFGQDAGNRDIGKSAKYAFAHLADQAARNGAGMPTSKEAAEAWFNEHIAPGFNQLGYTVHQVEGDKAFVSTREFPQGQWIDFLANAGGDNPSLWWGAENPGEGGGTATGPLSSGRTGGTVNGADLTSSELFDELLRQARLVAQGGNPGPWATDRDALLRLLVNNDA